MLRIAQKLLRGLDVRAGENKCLRLFIFLAKERIGEARLIGCSNRPVAEAVQHQRTLRQALPFVEGASGEPNGNLTPGIELCIKQKALPYALNGSGALRLSHIRKKVKRGPHLSLPPFSAALPKAV